MLYNHIVLYKNVNATKNRKSELFQRFSFKHSAKCRQQLPISYKRERIKVDAVYLIYYFFIFIFIFIIFVIFDLHICFWIDLSSVRKFKCAKCSHSVSLLK